MDGRCCRPGPTINEHRYIVLVIVDSGMQYFFDAVRQNNMMLIEYTERAAVERRRGLTIAAAKMKADRLHGCVHSRASAREIFPYRSAVR